MQLKCGLPKLMLELVIQMLRFHMSDLIIKMGDDDWFGDMIKTKCYTSAT